MVSWMAPQGTLRGAVAVRAAATDVCGLERELSDAQSETGCEGEGILVEEDQGGRGQGAVDPGVLLAA